MDIVRAEVSREFLTSLAGCFFYAPPLKGLVPSEDLLKHVFGVLSYSKALFADLCLDSPKLKKLSEDFMQARSENTKLMALTEGFLTRGRTVVLPSWIQDFGGLVIELQDSNHSDACKPTNKDHRAYRELVNSIGEIMPGIKDTSHDQRSSALGNQVLLAGGSHSPSNSKEDRQGAPSLSESRGFFSNIMKVVSGPGPFYGNQCRILKAQLSFAKEILSKGRAPNGISAADRGWPQLALTELRRVVKLGKTLIKGCHDDKHCLNAYLRQGERTQAFAESLKEILWCISVVAYYYNIDRRLPWNPSVAMDDFPQARLGDEQLHLLQEAVVDDQNELEASIASWISKHSACSAKVCGMPSSQHQAEDFPMCLADQIKERRLNSEGDTTTDAPKVESYASALWKTCREAVISGTQIGSGSAAVVYETTWLGNKYAKKQFHMVPQPAEFEVEVNALAKLNHPHIIKISAYSAGPHSCFFLMEMMVSLRTFMVERMDQLGIDRPFSMAAAIDLMLQISEAMSYMNSENMVHRDLKSTNILVRPVHGPELCKEGFVTAKLTDFGLAKTNLTSRMTPNTGTRLWMAPEIFALSPVEDGDKLLIPFPNEADVYSFGITCSEIITGKLPFHEHGRLGAKEFHKWIMDPDNPMRPKLPENSQDCPESLASLIRKCWNTDPKRRPAFERISKRLRCLKGLFMMEDAHH